MSGNLVDDLPGFARAVRAARREPGRRWSQSRLAEAAGVSRDPVSRVENGGDISLSTALSLIRALGYRLRLEPRTGTFRAADMRELFAHVHEEGEE